MHLSWIVCRNVRSRVIRGAKLVVLIRTRPRRRSSICTLSAIPISARPRVAIRCWTSRAQCGVGQAPRCQRAQAGVGRKVLPKPGAMPRARRHFCALPHFRSRCDAHSESAGGQNEPCHSFRLHGRSTSISGPAGPAVGLPGRADIVAKVFLDC